MEELRRSSVRGLVAGTAGTTALFATTYLDMAIRGRPASRTPEQTVEQMADLLGVTLPGDAEARQARAEGLGNLLGLAAGVTTGAALGVLRGLGVEPAPTTPKAFGDYIKAETTKWAKVIRTAGIKLE